MTSERHVEREKLLSNATAIYDYMRMMGEQQNRLSESDLIFVMCSNDIRVAHHAADLFQRGLSQKMLISGGRSHFDDLLREPWEEIPSVEFKNVAVSLDVPEEAIITEEKSTNTGENITFSHALLDKSGDSISSIVLVQKPFMLRRAYAAFMKLWPNAADLDVNVSSQEISFPNYIAESNFLTEEEIINLMVGDLQRIKEYPALGYQIPQDIPSNVQKAADSLINLDYTKHLIK